MLKTILIGLVVTVVTIIAFSVVQSATAQTGDSGLNGQPTSEVVGENEVKVDISGEINHPGEYSISPEETLGTLISMAGGVTSKADSKAYNPSIYIGTYVSFYIPPVTELPAICVEETIEKVNINIAGEAELKEVGFNSSQAPNVVTYREENGLFQVLEDLLNVKGIGEATFNKVKNKICLS